MYQNSTTRVGYVVKQYPRYSETFIVNEILAHEAAPIPIDIFSLRRSSEGHFQDCLARVNAMVYYLPSDHPKVQDFWIEVGIAMRQLPGLASSLDLALAHPAGEVHQAIHLAYQVQTRRITHLHAHFASAATTVTRLAARFAGVPFSFTAHAKDIFHKSVCPTDFRQKLADASAVVTVSDFNRHYLLAEYGSDADKVRRIYNGLDLEQFPFASPEQRMPRVLAAGRLVEKKGFPVLIEACAILAREGRQFVCDIVGTGVLEDSLHAQIRGLELENVVQMLGARPQRQLFELMQNAALFAAPCIIAGDQDRDGLPTVLLEAMALGTPCVTTDVTGIPEAVQDGETGLVVPQGDAQALADAMARLLDDADLRVAVATKARMLVERNFDVHRSAASLRQLFESIDSRETSHPAATLREAV